MKEIFQNIPFEIVKHILSYDKRYIIRNGNIIIINPIDIIKYQNIIRLLESKPKIQDSGCVQLSKKIKLFCNVKHKYIEYVLLGRIDTWYKYIY